MFVVFLVTIFVLLSCSYVASSVVFLLYVAFMYLCVLIVGVLYFQWAHRCWSSEFLTGNFITFGLRLQKQKCSFMVLWVSYLGNMKLSKVHRDVDIVSSSCTFQSWIRFDACLWCVILNGAVVLSHKMSDGVERLIAFTLRTLTDSEQKYTEIEQKALVSVVCAQPCHWYLALTSLSKT